jgi:ribosomal protein L31
MVYVGSVPIVLILASYAGDKTMIEITRINRTTVYNVNNEAHPYYAETIAIAKEGEKVKKYMVILDYMEDGSVRGISELVQIMASRFQKSLFEVPKHYINQINYDQDKYTFGEINEYPDKDVLDCWLKTCKAKTITWTRDKDAMTLDGICSTCTFVYMVGGTISEPGMTCSKEQYEKIKSINKQ